MQKDELEKLKEKFEETGAEVDISFEDENDSSRELTRHEIKDDPLLRVKYFRIFYNEFKRIFRKEPPQKLLGLFSELDEYYTEFKGTNSLPRQSHYKRKIYACVQINSSIIFEFLDDCWDIWGLE